MPGITVRVGSRSELTKLARRLRSAGSGGLQRELSSNLRREARPVLTRTKAAVRGASFSGSQGGQGDPNGSTRLRGRLAAATSVTSVGSGLRFEVKGAQVDPRYGTRLAKLSDTELAPRWRHPVFGWPGRRNTAWTTQTGQPWFFVTIRSYGPQFRGAVARAMEKTAQKITG